MHRSATFLALALFAAVAIAGTQVFEATPDEPVLVPGTVTTGGEMLTPDAGLDGGYILQSVPDFYHYGYTGFGSYSMGYRFTPLFSGVVSKIGRERGPHSEASTVKLWDASSGAVLASAEVTGTGWSYVDITPVTVTAGQQYWITTHLGNNVAYGYITTSVPYDINDIRILEGGYGIGDAMPIYNSGTMIYGMADIYFEAIPTTWTGAVSSDWNTPGNWNYSAVPVAGNNVLIPAGLSTYPTTNTGAGYACKNLEIESGASLTVVAGKTLACGDILNSGTMTNNGRIECAGDFANNGSFTSGTGSQFHFVGMGTASLTTGVDASLSFFDVYVSTLDEGEDELGGGDPTVGGGTWFGGTMYTFVTQSLPATRSGSVVRWQLYCWYSVGEAQLKVYRAGYNGYQFGLVGESQVRTTPSSSGMQTYHDVIHGVEAGDYIGAAYTNMTWGGIGSEGFYYAVGNVGSRDNWSYYSLAQRPRMRAYMVGPGGGVEAVGDVDINGDLVIGEGRVMTNTGGDYSLAGDLVNNGTFDIGDGDITFDGSTWLNGSGDFTFNTVNITGTLTAAPLITVNGDWNNAGTFTSGGGHVIVRGGQIAGNGSTGAFRDLTIDNATDGDVAIVGNLNVEGTLALNAGNFLLGGNTLTLGRATAAGAVTVGNGAGFRVVGASNTERGTVTAVAAAYPYAFTVHGAIAARYANFSWMGANGIDIRSGATISATDNFSHTTFTAGNTVGTMLKIANSQVIDDIVHADFIAADGYNIDYAAGSGHLTITDGTGNRWGEDYDNDPSNLVDWEVSIPPYDPGWVELQNAPGLVRNGGFITFNEGDGLFYGTPGNKTLSFWMYDRATGWSVVPAGIPAGARPTNKGTAGVTDGDNFVYVVKGNNTPEFYRYNITEGTWETLQNIPAGTSGKIKVKITALAYHDGYVYMQKNNKGDFLRFNTETLTWEDLGVMPAGAKPRWNAGSFIAVDPLTGLVYAHKARFHEFYAYDPAAAAWGPALPGMPLMGATGKNKKSKDGGSGTFFAGGIHALKGGNTCEFFRYDIAGNAWTEHQLMPDVGTTGKRKRVKGGGSVASSGDGAFFAFKGNKTFEFWRYFPPTPAVPRPERSGVMAGETAGQPFVKLGPNPLAGGFATLRYSLPTAGPASVNVFDVTGRTVLSRGFAATRSGAVSLDLRSLSAGIYLVKVEADGFSGTQKLVVQQ